MGNVLAGAERQAAMPSPISQSDPHILPPRRGGHPTREEAARLGSHILRHAVESFCQHGYDGTSMDALARQAGVSKRTLYTRFPTKGDLFMASVAFIVDSGVWPVVPEEPGVPVRESLTRCLCGMLDAALDPFVLTLERILLADIGGQLSDSSQRLLEAFERGVDLIQAILERGIETGEIEVCDTRWLAGALLELAVSSPRHRIMLGQLQQPTAAVKRQEVERCVAALVR